MAGIVVMQTVPGSPAEKAGLRGLDISHRSLGDVIVAVNGKPVDRLPDLANELEEIGVGKTATLTVDRSGQEITMRVEVADIAARDGAEKPPAR